ncbi:helix-turn-helix transcriptional regulator [Agrobacterium tumefaciens]|nr:helix-turn-helix transcriptional regulator [Agrobacterium tumefaciens]RRN74745.1 XRE family transcriptional regulator [Agrobacterium deltaense]NSZ02692.1 helix-turn-helix transcriptional regulator [Agrobacterium tumefaciens]NSZ40894.1 helix-turn-helix transcriptional regulator [Agrobacterium tumefaciens]NTB00969.1 helix-turn-helix transcriptional regulator [Agrobacterium tumefaciens]
MPFMEIKKRFGLAVKEKRVALGISQEELAMRIEADQAYVSRVEAGQINVTLETMHQIASALKTDAAELLILRQV